MVLTTSSIDSSGKMRTQPSKQDVRNKKKLNKTMASLFTPWTSLVLPVALVGIMPALVSVVNAATVISGPAPNAQVATAQVATVAPNAQMATAHVATVGMHLVNPPLPLDSAGRGGVGRTSTAPSPLSKADTKGFSINFYKTEEKMGG